MKYFPYLRGKQFELIALRDICSLTERGDIISPIIEPVRPINATLTKTIDCLREHSYNFNLILNPQEGEITPDEYENLVQYAVTIYKRYQNFQPTFLINERVNIPQILFFIREYQLENISLICTQQPNNEEDFAALLTATSIRFVILEDDGSFVID